MRVQTARSFQADPCLNVATSSGTGEPMKQRICLVALLLTAAVVYSRDLSRPLMANEAYSAWIAGQPDVGSVVAHALRFDAAGAPLRHGEGGFARARTRRT